MKSPELIAELDPNKPVEGKSNLVRSIEKLLENYDGSSLTFLIENI